jgi:hypothetical protein
MASNEVENKQGKPLTHFFDMVEDLIEKVRGSDNISCIPELDIYTSSEDITMPCISYSITNRNISEEVSGLKPVHKDFDRDKEIELKSQQFDTMIDFSIWHNSSYKEINKEREWFEEFMLMHIDTFRKESMLMVLFREQLKDTVVEIKNNNFIRQPLRYLVRNERIFKIPFDKIEQIDTRLKDFPRTEDLNKFNL